MLIFAIIFCAIVVITYLIQFQAYRHSQDKGLEADSSVIIGLPIENDFEFEHAVENN